MSTTNKNINSDTDMTVKMSKLNVNAKPFIPPFLLQNASPTLTSTISTLESLKKIEETPDDWEMNDRDDDVLKGDYGSGGSAVSKNDIDKNGDSGHISDELNNNQNSTDVTQNENAKNLVNISTKVESKDLTKSKTLDAENDNNFVASETMLLENDFDSTDQNDFKDDPNQKENINIVFIGHVDAGKSTIGGQLMYLTGAIDKRTLEKYEKDAKEKSRDSWYLSWALDTNQEERDKGKTVEVGRAFFETPTKKFTLLDAPGHKCYVPNMITGTTQADIAVLKVFREHHKNYAFRCYNMITGTTQADIAVLVISARKGEFETGFERGGQTQEHAMLAKTIGVRHLIILINKMDDPTVNWDVNRYNECKEKLIPFLRKVGFNPKTDVYFMPVSGLQGTFLKRVPSSQTECPALAWYSGPSFLDYLESFPAIERQNEGPLRIPIIDRYRDMGTLVMGKIESGYLRKGQTLLLMPNKNYVEVLQMWADDDEIRQARSGDNIKLKLKGVEEEDVRPGFVLCDTLRPCKVGRIFDCQIIILELKSIISPGFSAILHVHTLIEEVTVKTLICLLDRKTGAKSTVKPRFLKQDQSAIVRLVSLGGAICLETFKDFPRMGRITLRDEGKTIAIGKILKIVE